LEIMAIMLYLRPQDSFRLLLRQTQTRGRRDLD